MEFDKYVESTLGNLVYDKYIKVCENQTSKAQINRIREIIENHFRSQEDIMRFTEYLHESVDMLKNRIEGQSIRIMSNLRKHFKYQRYIKNLKLHIKKNN